jgi:hypothetical protein
VASGSSLAVVLFYLAPLPILIAAIGWSHLAGLIAALTAAAALALLIDSVYFPVFLVGIGAPAWWLGYLSLLGRPAATNGATDIEWYPAGRLVLWAAVLGAAVVTIGLFNYGFDAEAVHGGLKRAFERTIRLHLRTPADAPLQFPGVTDSGRLLDLAVVLLPPAAALVSGMTNLFNLWLAGRIVAMSGRLKRPWPVLPAMTFPPMAALALVATIAVSFASGLVGIVAGIFALALLFAYAILGLAVLHHITVGMNSRGFVLAGMYALIVVFLWPIVLMVLLGLIDAVFDLRGRVAANRGPPPQPT